ANDTEAYYVFRRAQSWVNGYSSSQYDPDGNATSWEGVNPFSLTMHYSPVNFPPPGTPITIGVTMLYDCHRDDQKNDFLCKFCPYRLFTNST
ncbi:17544_t:CDS:1, partial [Racocetra fulgida]